MDEILKGNYKVPRLENADTPKEEKPVSLEEEFEAAALKKLGGSITFVRKSGRKPGKRSDSFIWRGENE